MAKAEKDTARLYFLGLYTCSIALRGRLGVATVVAGVFCAEVVVNEALYWSTPISYEGLPC